MEAVISLDKGRILQVLANLLSNAIKFTATGGRITIRADARAGDIVVSVEDTGVGISAECCATTILEHAATTTF